MSSDYLDFDSFLSTVEAAELGVESAEDYFDEDDLNSTSFEMGKTPSVRYGRRASELKLHGISMEDWSYYGGDDR